MKKLYLLTAAAVLLTGCGAVGGDNGDSPAGTTSMTAPDTDGGYYDPSSVTIDFTAPAEGV